MSFEPEPLLLAVVLAGLAGVVWWHRGALRSASAVARIVALLCLVGVALQPRLGGEAVPPAPTGADVLVIVDRTTSMAAQDYDAGRPRMEGVAHDMAEVVAGLPEARYAVVSSDNEARITAPWTTDTNAVLTLARTMGWREEGFGTGSDIAVAVPLAQSLLVDSARLRPAAARYLVYMGDGEQISPDEPASFAPLAELVDEALVLGYGSTQGGVMAMRVDTDELVTRNGEPQLSMIDASRLQTIARQLGGSYEHRVAPDPLTGWDPPAAAPVGGTGAEPGARLGWLLALAAAGVLAIDVAHASARARRTRMEVRR